VKCSSSHAEGVTILERSDHLEMAQDRLEECLQALAARKDTGAAKRGKWLVNSVDTDPSLGRNQIREGWR
jgi:hypothetical protein